MALCWGSRLRATQMTQHLNFNLNLNLNLNLSHTRTSCTPMRRSMCANRVNIAKTRGISSGSGGSSLGGVDLNQTVEEEAQRLYKFLRTKRNVVCITGAGVSTASGIPDYRGVNGSYRKGHKPMVHSEFMSSHSSRQRYWSRSMKGFRYLGDAEPNDAHNSIRDLQQRGAIKHIITQNVDGLHSKAGSEGVLNIHGRIDEVKCMACNNVTSRHDFQDILESHNPSFLEETSNVSMGLATDSSSPFPPLKPLPSSEDLDKVRADGDLELDPSVDISKFHVPSCKTCGTLSLDSTMDMNREESILKPNVVFFGDTVPRASAQEATKKVEECDGMLIVGTTLEVYSVFRLVRAAFQSGVPIAILNQGETRVEREALNLLAASNNLRINHKLGIDEIIQFKSDGDCGKILATLSSLYRNI